MYEQKFDSSDPVVVLDRRTLTARSLAVSNSSATYADMLFDCHGGFDGIVLDGCSGTRIFRSGVKLVPRACREHLTLAVLIDPDRDDKIRGLTGWRAVVRGMAVGWPGPDGWGSRAGRLGRPC